MLNLKVASLLPQCAASQFAECDTSRNSNFQRPHIVQGHVMMPTDRGIFVSTPNKGLPVICCNPEAEQRLPVAVCTLPSQLCHTVRY